MTDFLKQFFDKRVWWVFAALLVTHVFAALVQDTVWVWIPLIAIGLGVVVASYQKLEWGLALAFLEIFIGGHGHLFDVDVYGFSLSIREVIFAAVMGVWFIQMLRRRVKPQFIAHRDLPFATIGLAVACATVLGFVSNGKAAAFDDMNSYLTLLYFFPMISVAWSSATKRLLLQVFAISAVWMAITTLGYLYAFTHLPGLASHELYTFVRDARLAEVTLLTSGRVVDLLGNSPWYFRVFQQSQAISVAFELLLITATLFMWRKAEDRVPRGLWLMHVLLMATILASMSRSFWLGSVAACIGIIVSVGFTKPRVIPLVTRHVALAGASLAALLTLFVLIAAPLPPRPDLSESSFYKGKDDNTRGVAVSSRWNLLGPMVTEIKAHPVFGSGFGEEVTYISDDPRLRAIDPTGAVTTYRFEWGYHDLWLKLGLLGLFGFGWYFVTVLSVVFESLQRKDAQIWLVTGLAAGVIMLFVAHIFSPYLNHPIGLAFMLFILPFFPWRATPEPETEAVKASVRSTMSLRKPAVGVAFTQK